MEELLEYLLPLRFIIFACLPPSRKPRKMRTNACVSCRVRFHYEKFPLLHMVSVSSLRSWTENDMEKFEINFYIAAARIWIRESGKSFAECETLKPIVASSSCWWCCSPPRYSLPSFTSQSPKRTQAWVSALLFQVSVHKAGAEPSATYPHSAIREIAKCQSLLNLNMKELLWIRRK